MSNNDTAIEYTLTEILRVPLSFVREFDTEVLDMDKDQHGRTINTGQMVLVVRLFNGASILIKDDQVVTATNGQLFISEHLPFAK